MEETITSITSAYKLLSIDAMLTISIISATFIAIGLVPSGRIKNTIILLLARFVIAFLSYPVVYLALSFAIAQITNEAYYTLLMIVLIAFGVWAIWKGNK